MCIATSIQIDFSVTLGDTYIGIKHAGILNFLLFTFCSLIQTPESKKQEFRKYLEKSGVIDALTKGKLYFQFDVLASVSFTHHLNFSLLFHDGCCDSIGWLV